MRRLGWLLIGMVLCSCTSSAQRLPMPDGYRVWVMNAREVYLANSEDVLIVGPKLVALGVSDHVIVTQNSSEDVTINGFANTPGYAVLDTRTGKFVAGLSMESMKDKVINLGVPIPEMRPASEWAGSERR